MVRTCCVLNCRSEGYPGCGISFFRFPKRDDLRQRWLNVIPTNKNITNDTTICSRHFKPEEIINFQKRSNLKPDAMPSIFPMIPVEEKRVNVLSTIILKPPQQENFQPVPSTSKDLVCGPSKYICKSATGTNEQENILPNLESSVNPTKKPRQDDIICSLSEDKNKLQYKVKLLKQRLKRREVKIKSLQCTLDIIKKKCANFEEVESVLVNNFSSIHKQINTKISDKNVRYSDELKSFALTLYYYSAKAYLFLRKHISLPHPSTLRRLLSTHDCNTGFMKEVFEFLRKTATNECYLKNVSLVFDAMSIRSELTYDKKSDKYWGYVDYGGITNNDSEALATEVLVLMIVSYTKKFKCPIGYFFINKTSANIQAQLISTAIRLLGEVNIKVRSLTCDGTVTNIKTYEILGCDFSTAEMKTYFMHPTIEIKVYCLLDPPHMIKLARNIFAETKLSSAKGEINFKYVRDLHKLQEEEGLKLKNKISAVHVNFYGKKMNVKLAVQVLSSSVADAIEFLDKSGHESFANSEATVEYIRILDRIFDIFNSKNPFGTGYKSPLRLSNKSYWMNAITETKNFLASLKINDDNILAHRRKTPALGLIIDCISFPNLVLDLLCDSTNNMKYFLPYKCSQDHVEIFFSCVRASGALNDNPSALQFRYILRKLLFRNSVQPSQSANIISDDSIQTTPVFEFRNPIRTTADIPHASSNEDGIEQLMEQIERTTTSEYKNNILYYIAGHIANKMSKKISCEHCIAAMFKKSEQSEHNYAVDVCKFSSFTAFIDRGKLKYVTRFIFDVVKYAEKIFLTTCRFSSMKEVNKKKMMLLVVQYFCTKENSYFYHPASSFNCEDSHELLMIKSIASSYFTLRLFSHTKSLNLKMLGQRSTLRQRLHKTVLFNNV